MSAGFAFFFKNQMASVDRCLWKSTRCYKYLNAENMAALTKGKDVDRSVGISNCFAENDGFWSGICYRGWPGRGWSLAGGSSGAGTVAWQACV